MRKVPELIQEPEEAPRLRACVRDLVALSTLPALWVGREPEAVVEGAVDLLVTVLRLDLAYIRISKSPGGTPIEAASVAGAKRTAQRAEDVGRSLDSFLSTGGKSASLTLSDLSNGRSMNVAAAPLGLEGSHGVVAAASARPDFPTELEWLLLTTAANQIATSLRSANALAEQQRMKESLALSETRLEQIIAQAPVAIAVMRGREHVFQTANSAYRQIVGNRQLLGRTIREAFPELEGQPYYDLLDRVYKTGKPSNAQEALVVFDRLDDGVQRDTYFNFVYQPLLDSDGAVSGIAVVAADVTDSVSARHHAEELAEQFRTLAESIPQLAWMADSKGSIFWYNQQWYDYTGTTLEEMKGWGWRSVHHPDELERVVRRVSDAFAAGASWEDTFPLRRKDGVYRWFLSRMLPIKDSEGRVVRFFGTNTDITEQHEAASEREEFLRRERASREEADRLRLAAEEARTAAETANAAKSEFLATMSHELRTPLNAIAGYVELLDMGLHGPVTVEQKEDLTRIKRSQQHLLGLINDILDIAKIDAGQIEYHLEDVRLDALVRDTETMVAPQLRAKGLTYRYGGTDASLTVWADAEKLQQILLNLLTNSIKFTPHGGTISVDCGHDEVAAWLRVCDSGVGISADKLETIFEPFVQVDRRLNNPGRGVGLGLAISRDFARGMGGELRVASAPGKGSTFTLTVPGRGEVARDN